MKKTIIFLILLILLVPIVLAGGYLDFVTIGQGDDRWCRLIGCTITDLIVDSLTVYNLSIIGQVFNVTMNLVTWNITESFNVGGNIVAKNGTFDNIIGNGSQLTSLTHSLQDAYDSESGVPRIIQGDDNYIYWNMSNDFYIDLLNPASFLITSDNFANNIILIDPFSISGKLRSTDWSPLTDGGNDLGYFGVGTDYRWDDLYLSGNLDDGTNSLTVANARTAYDFTTNNSFLPFNQHINLKDYNISNTSLSAEEVNRDLPTNCPANSCVSAWGDNLSTTTCSSFQPPLINSSNITCIGNQCYYNGTTGETDTTVNNTGFVNITELVVRNITSPYANKSYIFFQPDGSVGITLDPIIPIVQAQEEKMRK